MDVDDSDAVRGVLKKQHEQGFALSPCCTMFAVVFDTH